MSWLGPPAHRWARQLPVQPDVAHGHDNLHLDCITGVSSRPCYGRWRRSCCPMPAHKAPWPACRPPPVCANPTMCLPPMHACDGRCTICEAPAAEHIKQYGQQLRNHHGAQPPTPRQARPAARRHPASAATGLGCARCITHDLVQLQPPQREPGMPELLACQPLLATEH